jgi:hypothetical protein
LIHLLLLAAGAVSCPVLNTATARGAVGEVQLTVNRSEKDSSYACRFAGADAELTIEVSTLENAGQFSHFAGTVCQGVPLKAIGNEAILCDSVVVGRVRKQAFVIRLTTTGKAARSKLPMLAEQVAGNLF